MQFSVHNVKCKDGRVAKASFGLSSEEYEFLGNGRVYIEDRGDNMVIRPLTPQEEEEIPYKAQRHCIYTPVPQTNTNDCSPLFRFVIGRGVGGLHDLRPMNSIPISAAQRDGEVFISKATVAHLVSIYGDKEWGRDEGAGLVSDEQSIDWVINELNQYMKENPGSIEFHDGVLIHASPPTKQQLENATCNWMRVGGVIGATKVTLHEFLGWTVEELTAWNMDPMKIPRRPLKRW